MSQFVAAYPNSRKVYVEGPQDVRVPMREIALSDGQPPLRVYDTSGPQGEDLASGLPRLREPWVASRQATRPPGSAVTQLYYARRGEVTPEMAFVAVREGVAPEFVRDEV